MERQIFVLMPAQSGSSPQNWQGYHRVEHNLIYLDIIGGKIWVQKDGTEDGITDELEASGVPKSDIVLAFHPLENRMLIPDYAVS